MMFHDAPCKQEHMDGDKGSKQQMSAQQTTPMRQHRAEDDLHVHKHGRQEAETLQRLGISSHDLLWILVPLGGGEERQGHSQRKKCLCEATMDDRELASR